MLPKTFLFCFVKITLFITLISYITGAPVPIPKDLDNTITEEEEGLLVLVPTVPVDGKGQPAKREVEYEVISIPKDLIRRTVKEVKDTYGTKSGPIPTKISGSGPTSTGSTSTASKNTFSTNTGSIFISDLKTGENDEILIKTKTGLKLSASERFAQRLPQRLPERTHVDDDDDFLRGFDETNNLRSAPAYSSDDSRESSSNLNILSSTDLSKILSSVASAGLSAASTGAKVAGQAKNVLESATRVGTSAVVGGTQAVRWALNKKTSGLRTFAEFAGTGLSYAGRLTSAVLKVLLRVPGIKARVISDLIQAGQPFASAVSDVIAESADDLGDIFSAQTDVFKDAINILFKLITDVLALKGRILASFGAGGLDKGTNLISAGVKVGSAFVQTAGDVVSAVGRGVGEIVQVASEVEFPPPPSLPSIKFPALPTLTYPSSSSSESYKAPAISYKSPSDSREGRI